MSLFTKSENLYISSEIKDIEKAFSQPLLYCLCISQSSPFVMEILFLRDLSKKVNAAKNYCIVGIALTKKSAVKAVAHIMTPFLTQQNPNLKNIKQLIDSRFNPSN